MSEHLEDVNDIKTKVTQLCDDQLEQELKMVHYVPLAKDAKEKTLMKIVGDVVVSELELTSKQHILNKLAQVDFKEQTIQPGPGKFTLKLSHFCHSYGKLNIIILKAELMRFSMIYDK